MIGARIVKLEKFFKVKKPKDMNWLDWGLELHQKTVEWEGENNREFPI